MNLHVLHDVMTHPQPSQQKALVFHRPGTGRPLLFLIFAASVHSNLRRWRRAIKYQSREVCPVFSNIVGTQGTSAKYKTSQVQ